MERLLQFLNLLTVDFRVGADKAVYDDADNRLLADYLAGKVKFDDKVKETLKKTVNYLDFSKYTNELREILADGDCPPEVQRLLYAVRYAINTYCYHQQFILFIKSARDTKMTVEDIYVKGGLGVDAFIVDVCELLHRDDVKSLGVSDCRKFFAGLSARYPDVYEDLAKADDIFALTYLYGGEPLKYEKEGKKVVDFGEGGEVWRKATSGGNKRESLYAFYTAYWLTNAPAYLIAVSVELIKRIGDFALYVYCATYKSVCGKEITLDELVPSFRDGTLPQKEFIAYFAWRYKEVKAIIPEYEKTALEAVQLKWASIDNKLHIMSVFWAKGQYLDRAEPYAAHVIEDVKQSLSPYVGLYEYLLHGGDVPVVSGKHSDYDRHVDDAVIRLGLLSAATTHAARLVLYFGVSRKIESLVWGVCKNYGEAGLEKVFNDTEMPLEERILFIINLYEITWNANKTRYEKLVAAIVKDDFDLLESVFKKTGAAGKAILLEIAYTANPKYNPRFLLGCLGESSKVVRELAMAYLTPLTELREQVEPLLQAKKKAVRESAERLMAVYDGDNPGSSRDKAPVCFNAAEYCAANIPKTAAKTIAWTQFDTLPKVRLIDSEDFASDDIVRGYIYLIVTQTNMVLPPAAANIRAGLNKDDLRELGLRLYDIWKDDGAMSKRRGVMLIAAIDGDDDLVNTLKDDISDWAGYRGFGMVGFRGALAAEAVRAMAVQGGNLALMTVDTMSKKFNNKQVKRAAEEAFGFAAEQLGVDPEVLGDKIVPTLGFDQRGELVIDYGNRQFIAVINPELQITLKNADGKVIKSLPAPNASDDADKATAAKKELAAIKKTLKSITALQCTRLEQALSRNRTWSKSSWSELFVSNPIMNMFAIGLIWGVYDNDGVLMSSFRYMEDGTFTDVGENEIELNDGDNIGLCHPLDLGGKLVFNWLEQLKDYEIKQPLEQLSRKVYTLDGDKKAATAITEFNGAKVYVVALLGKLQKLGWQKGTIEDGATYDVFYKVDSKQKIAVQLKFKESYIGADTAEETTVYDAVFYNPAKTKGHYSWREINEEERIKLADVPARLYSEVCYDIDRATFKRIED